MKHFSRLAVLLAMTGCAAPDMGSPRRAALNAFRQCEAAVYATTGVANAAACQKYLDDMPRKAYP